MKVGFPHTRVDLASPMESVLYAHYFPIEKPTMKLDITYRLA